MPVITIQEGRFLQFEDSGVPADSNNYSTVFIIHGFVFYSPCFRPLFSHARRYNLRLITITVQGYPGSSPLTDAQAAALTSTSAEAISEVILDLSTEIAFAIAQIIKNENLPAPIEVGGRSLGGVSIMAWSAGNVLMLSILGNIAALAKDVSSTLEHYLISCVMYDAPCVRMGFTRPPDVYVPSEDTSLLPTELADRFMVWAASYYEQFTDLSKITAEAIVQLKSVSETTPNPKYSSTLTKMTHEEINNTTYPAVVSRCPTPNTLTAILGVYRPNTDRAIFDTKGAWPKVKVLVLWADMSILYCPWGAKVLSDTLAEPVENGMRRRHVEIMRLEEANHFFHWEYPEEMVRILNEHMAKPI